MPTDYLTPSTRVSKIGWKEAALRVGEELAPNGPEGYYEMTPEEWLSWALSMINPLAAAPTPALEGSKRRSLKPVF